MRSMLFAMAIAAIATISTGCTMSCKFSGPCRTISQTCSIDQCGPSCTGCSSNNCRGFLRGRMLRSQGSACGGDCGDCGTMNGTVVQNMQTTQQQTMQVQNAAGCNDGCPDGLMGGGCATGDCGSGLAGRGGLLGGGLLQGRGKMLGSGLFSRAGGCGGNCGDESCGCGNANAAPMGGAMMGPMGAMGGAMGSLGARGCGKFGCGQGGMLCSGCRGLGLGGLRGFGGGGHPYGGQVPHTPAPSYGGMGGAAPTPSYSYPYYTTRGPRDFLNPNPPSIGR